VGKVGTYSAICLSVVGAGIVSRYKKAFIVGPACTLHVPAGIERI
jgi:hypothetical protein